MSKSTPRQANFELMRILAMFLIVIWHIKGHYMEGADAIHPIVYKAFNFISTFISFHVDLFILITGYFGIRNNKRAIVKNIILCALYLWSFNIISYLVTGTVDVYELIFPISHSPWWFMTIYFMLVMVAPFLEKMFTTFSGKEWTTWIVTVCAINVYFGHYHHVGSVYLVGFNLVNMINVYSIGTALRNPKLRITSIGGGNTCDSVNLPYANKVCCRKGCAVLEHRDKVW